MEKIVIVAHGSPRESANKLSALINLLAKILNKSLEDIRLCFLQFAKPSLEDVLNELISCSPETIIVHPLFLSDGYHVTYDIPNIIKKFKEKYPKIEILYTKPLGIHEKLAEVIKDRIEEIKPLKRKEIEEKSFEIIEREINLKDLPEEQKLIIKRVIHATADLEYQNSMIFHPLAIPKAISALKKGKNILVDTEMLKVGISKKYLGNSKVICYLSKVKKNELNDKETYTEKAIEVALNIEKNIGIIAIGNSPKALLKTINILNKKQKKDIVVIGMPVGFVKALDSKILLSKQDFPFITNISRKGGTPATIAVINALLRLKEEI
ncbi:MAG: hypothetical protein DRP29_01135 [Thermodesulfobacteriota bacterium]|nr:MAG: hypothetical protein DRP29_01135 [Thermodesulfobacteriota bacterium]RLG12401.1 MAG: hypothetical protein DRN73_02665 [Candidatus Pacearchaeota archaeon]